MQFLEGYLLGLGMILFIGPVFFLLLSITLQLGTKSGILVASGIIVSDILCVILCYFGLTSFLNHTDYKQWIGIVGGILLILLGLKYIFKPESTPMLENNLSGFHYITCFIKGFLVNFVNPFVFFVWIGVVSYSKETAVNKNDTLFYLLGVLSAILTTDLLKVIAAKQIKIFLNPKVLKNLYLVSGIVFLGFGIRMVLIYI